MLCFIYLFYFLVHAPKRNTRCHKIVVWFCWDFALQRPEMKVLLNTKCNLQTLYPLRIIPVEKDGETWKSLGRRKGRDKESNWIWFLEKLGWMKSEVYTKHWEGQLSANTHICRKTRLWCSLTTWTRTTSHPRLSAVYRKPKWEYWYRQSTDLTK